MKIRIRKYEHVIVILLVFFVFLLCFSFWRSHKNKIILYDQVKNDVFNGYSSQFVWDSDKYTVLYYKDELILYDKEREKKYPFLHETWQEYETASQLYPQNGEFYFLQYQNNDFRICKMDKQFNQESLYEKTYGYTWMNQLRAEEEAGAMDVQSILQSSNDFPVQFVCRGDACYYLSYSGLWKVDFEQQKADCIRQMSYEVPFLSLCGEELFFVEDDYRLRSYHIGDGTVTEYSEVMTDAFVVMEQGIVFSDICNQERLYYYSFETSEKQDLHIGSCINFDVEGNDLYYCKKNTIKKKEKIFGEPKTVAKTQGNVLGLKKLKDVNRFACVYENEDLYVEVVSQDSF